jgi:hypothetical protein
MDQTLRFSKRNDLFKTSCIFAGFMCLLAVVPFHISSFFRVLRYSVCGVAIWAAITSFNSREYIGFSVFSMIAVLFNPVMHIKLDVSYWKLIDITSSLFFFIGGHRLKVDGPFREISDKEAQKIRDEYLKAEELRRQAEMDRKKAMSEREIAEELRRKAEEEWENIRSKMGSLNDEMKNPYVILGVHENDSLEIIREVYRKLVQIYHPDKHGGADDLSRKQKNELMSRINASYEWILKHHNARTEKTRH